MAGFLKGAGIKKVMVGLLKLGSLLSSSTGSLPFDETCVSTPPLGKPARYFNERVSLVRFIHLFGF